MHNKLLIMMTIIIFLFGFVFIKHSNGYRENFEGFKENHTGQHLSQTPIDTDSDTDDGEGSNDTDSDTDSDIDDGEGSNETDSEGSKEGFLNISKLFKSSSNCPNKIIQREDGIYLYDTNKLDKPGVNPIVFQRLEEYLNYVRRLRSNNIDCPILYYKEIYTTQNEKKYKYIPELSTTLPQQPITKLYDANRSPNSIFNSNLYPGFDPQDQYVGLNTPLDKMFQEKEDISDNPMDDNWGGRKFTDAEIKSGKYKGNEVIMEVA